MVLPEIKWIYKQKACPREMQKIKICRHVNEVEMKLA